jgi:hypothetical protein
MFEKNVAGSCFTTAGHAISISLFTGVANAAAAHDVAVKVTGHAGEKLLESTGKTTTTQTQPNGPNCSPTCFNAQADFTVP